MKFIFWLVALLPHIVYSQNQTIIENANTTNTANTAIQNSNKNLNFACKPFLSGPECSYSGVCHEDAKRCVCFDGHTSSLSGSIASQCDYKQKIHFMLL